MYPPNNFQPFDLFGQQPEMGLQPEDFLGLRMQQYDPSQMDVNLPIGNQGYQPEHQISDQFMRALQEMPTREKPNFGRKLLGAIGGLGINDPEKSLQVSDTLTNKPYYQKLNDWRTRIEPLEKGSEIENRRNINSRMLSTQTEANRIRQQNADTTERKQKATEENQRKRTEVYDFKARHPDWKLVTEKGGNVFAVNPQFPSMKVDTGIDSGTLSEMDKVNLQLDNKIQGIIETGEQNRATVGVRGEETRKNIGAQGAQTRETEGVKGEEARKTKETPSPNISRPQARKSTVVTKDAKGNVTGTRETTFEPLTGISLIGKEGEKRQKAINILTEQKKPVTEANIKFVMDKL